MGRSIPPHSASSRMVWPLHGAPIWQIRFLRCPSSVFSLPDPGIFCRCEPRPIRPPYRHGATQTTSEENKGERPKPRSVGTTSAVQALPVQTQIVTTVTEVGRVHFLPSPSPHPESVGLHFPEGLARGRRRQGCDGRVAAPGGERRPP